MALNDEELLSVYRNLHAAFPEDAHIARPLIHMLQQRNDIVSARDLAMTMAKRMLAAGQAERASIFLELCRSLQHPQKNEIKALTELAAITVSGQIDAVPGETHVFMLIDQLSDQEALDFFRLARLLPVKKDVDVVCQGDMGSSFFIVLEGEMRVHVAMPEHDRIYLGNLRPGQFFGEFTCLYQLPRSATVTAACPGVLLEFSDLSVTQLARRSPLAGEQMMRTIQTRVVQAMSRSHPALEGIPETDRCWLVEESRVLEFKNGDSIRSKEPLEDACCIIAYGTAKACVERLDTVLCMHMQAGDMFGGPSAYLRLPPNTRIVALDHCLVCCIPKDIFQSFMNAYGSFEAWVKAHALERTRQWRHAADKAGLPTIKS